MVTLRTKINNQAKIEHVKLVGLKVKMPKKGVYRNGSISFNKTKRSSDLIRSVLKENGYRVNESEYIPGINKQIYFFYFK